MTTTYTTAEMIGLEDPRASDPAVAGTKGAGLARLRAAGFTVPDAVVFAVGIAQAWPSGPAPGSVRTAVAEACARLDAALAVRTSATWEDGATSAHAGATATLLGVSGVDETLAAIRHCLDASAQAARDHGISGDIAVVVQRLVAAEWAGVAFTADPLTGERDVVRIAATEGLSEALVQGDVVGSDVTVRKQHVDGDLAGLPGELALAVAEVAREVEASFGRPQDIEWAVAEGKVWLVQARPITALPTKPTPPQGNNWQKDIAHYPEPLTPFGWSILHACGDQIRGVFDEMGLLIRGLEEAFVGGEVYGRVLPAFGSADSAGKPPPAIVLGIAARLVPALRRRTATAKRAIQDNRVQRWVDDWHQRDRDAMAARALELGSVDLAELDEAGLCAHLDATLDLALDGQRIHFRLFMPLAQRLHRLHRFVANELGWDDPTIATMLGGHSPATRAAEEAMALLRERIRGTDGAVAALEAQPGRPAAALAAVEPALADELEAWTAEHGWALINYDAGVPVLAERPTLITRLVLAEPEPANHTTADEIAEQARQALPPPRRAEFDRVLADARDIYPVREDNTIIVGDRPLALLRRTMLEAGRRLAVQGHFPEPADAAYLFIDELRAAIGGGPTSDLADRVVRRRGEEAWVRANPGPAYIGKQAPPPDTSRLPEPLRQVNEPILWVVSHEYPTPTPPPADTDVLLAGVAASPGIAEGPVRLIRGHDDMHRLTDGDVLVCRVTSPAWAPLFPLACAVVADGGGALSHAAIAAREHGIPAVLGTGDATTTLHDGQHIRIDGNRGLILSADPVRF
ncbi:MAG TPA: PEP/pyruvate-binding domain-containing protein [Acidimicrobiales bacterium]|nr:PEP/pyruvate-binding domain-containing protein [Acidimicrobiales bacterium]